MAPAGSAPSPHRRQDDRSSHLFLGVVVWSDDTEVEPTVIAGRNPLTVAWAAAIAIHEMIDDSPAYEGATEFLESKPPPSDWERPEDVDAWLEALREATPYPAYSFHEVPIAGGAAGTNHTVVTRYLSHELRSREHQLDADPDAEPGRAATRADRGRGM